MLNENRTLIDGTTFLPIPLNFELGHFVDVFAGKNNKTVLETIEHRRYLKFRSEVLERYGEERHEPLGAFLLRLKLRNDLFYQRFLNRYGDLKYSKFSIREKKDHKKRGIYAYFSGDRLKYIGRCRDTMQKRVNQGYGKIHPKNCYIDGQATNCRLNALITSNYETVSLWLHPLTNEEEIFAEERRLISLLAPSWNLQK